jgi:hypothetical protein
LKEAFATGDLQQRGLALMRRNATDWVRAWTLDSKQPETRA